MLDVFHVVIRHLYILISERRVCVFCSFSNWIAHFCFVLLACLPVPLIVLLVVLCLLQKELGIY